MSKPKQVPFMLFADAEGNIIESPKHLCVGRIGDRTVTLKPDDFIELPYGSELFFLPKRNPFGLNIKTNTIELFEEGTAVSTFASPAYTQTYLSAYETKEKAPILPLYAYTAVGWLDDKFYTTAVRIDPDIRQDNVQFEPHIIKKQVKRIQKKYPGNKLVDHLTNNCALNYSCRAAQNFVLGRWECPIPSSPACNAECLGCISLQPEDHKISSSHFRLKFTPDPKEIAEIAIDHLETAPTPIVSFGQGCEGEPLLVWETIQEAIILIREKTKKGIINMNTNGSKPETVEKLCKVGLQSIRVSMNSAQKEWYTPYYLPRNYQFEDIKESIKRIRKYGGWASINYFTFPGLTDTEVEYQALRNFIKETDLTMIQWRNFNIDPDWYIKKAKMEVPQESMGVANLMKKIKEEFPHIAYGYFNPIEETQQKYLAMR